MRTKLPLLLAAAVFTLVLVLVAVVWKKSQVQPSASPAAALPVRQVKNVDLSTQPEWVQNLVVTAKKGRSANSLSNVTVTAQGLPAGLVSTVDYVIQYQTTNKGIQGALSTNPVPVNGAASFSRTIDLGTCSTASCVRHEGVTAVDIELDFTTASGAKFTWAKSLNL